MLNFTNKKKESQGKEQMTQTLTFLVNHQEDEAHSMKRKGHPMHHQEILSTSQRILKQRGNEYGDISASFVRASTIASAVSGKPITAYDVAVIMMSVKMSRIGYNKENMDSWFDLINYTSFAGQFAQDNPNNIHELNLAETKQNIADAIKADAS